MSNVNIGATDHKVVRCRLIMQQR